MKILLTTPAGCIGRRILPELLAPEFSVRIISRNPNRLPREILEQVEVVQGSIADVKTLREALGGVEAVFWCAPRESFQDRSEGGGERFARAASLAVRAAGTPRVVTISGWSPGLRAMENMLNESGAAIRHLRCPWLMENLLPQASAILQHGVISYPVPGHVPIAMVAAADIADAALRRLVRSDWTGIERVALQGPQNLSLTEAAAIIERILERSVRYQEASRDAYVQTLIGSRAGAEHAQSQPEVFSNIASSLTRAEPGTTQSSLPTALAAWVRKELLPLLEPLDQGIGTWAVDTVASVTCV